MKAIFGLFFVLTSLSASALTIGTYNIRNFDYDQRYRISTNKVELAAILKGINADVLSIEEINNTAKWDEFVATKLPGYATEVSRCGGAHGQSLGFLYNARTVELLSFNEDLATSGENGQGGCNSGSRPLAIALFQVKATKQKFFGITAHLKSGSNPSSLAKRERQFQIIKEIIQDIRYRTGIKDFFLAGDLNTTGYLAREADYKILNNVVRELGMITLTANLGCSAYWWGGTDDGIETPSLLDHVIATPGLVKRAGARAQNFGHCRQVSCREVSARELGISYESVSDHCPITATIQ